MTGVADAIPTGIQESWPEVSLGTTIVRDEDGARWKKAAIRRHGPAILAADPEELEWAREILRKEWVRGSRRKRKGRQTYDSTKQPRRNQQHVGHGPVREEMPSQEVGAGRRASRNPRLLSHSRQRGTLTARTGRKASLWGAYAHVHDDSVKEGVVTDVSRRPAVRTPLVRRHGRFVLTTNAPNHDPVSARPDEAS